MSSKVYVGNLPFSSTEDELFSLFGADSRQVKEVAIITDRETGRPRGFAFVTMGSDDDARAAVEALDGASLGGRALRVNIAEERQGGRGRGPRGDGRGPRW